MIPPTMSPATWESVAGWTRFYSGRSESLYRTHSGADKTDAEMYRLVAAALRRVLGGESVEAAVAWYRAQWADFAGEQNDKVNKAPKMKHGPMSGCSAIHYKWAGDGEQGVTCIYQACREVAAVAEAA